MYTCKDGLHNFKKVFACSWHWIIRSLKQIKTDYNSLKDFIKAAVDSMKDVGLIHYLKQCACVGLLHVRFLIH